MWEDKTRCVGSIGEKAFLAEGRGGEERGRAGHRPPVKVED